MAFVVGFVMWFVGVGLIWFAIQTIKNPTPVSRFMCSGHGRPFSSCSGSS
jgi:hypothetical protein